MRPFYTCIIFLFACLSSIAQTPITAVTISTATAPSSYNYLNGGNTYNWGLSPNNTTTSVDGFTAGVPYSYASLLTGSVKLRRVNNALTTGNFSLVWAEVVISGTVFNMFPAYQNDMQPFFNNRTYNKGTDNFFDNISSNSNNIERLDWILNSSYSTPAPDKVGFAVFERGAIGAHDPFCIAAITSLDGLGNPSGYSNIVRVVAANYGEPGPNVTYRILKATYPADLLDAGTNTQNRGGVIISLQNLGIAANTPIYGYSLFANDLPGGATAANLVDYTNATYFPINTGAAGGIDLVAVTGIYIANSLLPVRFTGFNAVEKNDNINLQWNVENETAAKGYDIERSTDGINYYTITDIKSTGNSSGSNIYAYADNAGSLAASLLYYRIKQYDIDGSFYYSKTILIRRNKSILSVIVYPNPSTNGLFITLANPVTEKITISVINAAGVQLVQQKAQLANGNNFLSIDAVDKLPAGIYNVVLHWNSGKAITKQFSKQ